MDIRPQFFEARDKAATEARVLHTALSFNPNSLAKAELYERMSALPEGRGFPRIEFPYFRPTEYLDLLETLSPYIIGFGNRSTPTNRQVSSYEGIVGKLGHLLCILMQRLRGGGFACDADRGRRYWII